MQVRRGLGYPCAIVAALPEHLQPLPAGRQRLPREVMEAHQRDRVISAAIEVFAKRGYQATTVDHIVAAATIGVGSFYALFDGKEDCFLQAFDRIVAQSRERIAAHQSPSAAWPEQACAALYSLLDLIAAEHFQARLVLVEAQTAGPVAEARYHSTLEQLAALMRRGRALGSATAQLPASFEEVTLAGLAWLLHQRLVVARLADIAELFPEMAEMLLEPYLGEAEASRVIAAQAATPAGS